MDNNVKNMLVLGGAAIAGGWGGSWASSRLGAALGLTLGPWGTAGGAIIGSLLATYLAKNMAGIDTPALPEPDSAAEAASE
jgi:hypothetical protein